MLVLQNQTRSEQRDNKVPQNKQGLNTQFCMTTPDCTLHNRHFKSWMILQKLDELGCEVLPHLPHWPDLSPANRHFSKHLNSFLQRKWSHNQQRAENAFQEFFESWSTDSYAMGIKLVSHWQKCVDCSNSYFDY